MFYYLGAEIHTPSEWKKCKCKILIRWGLWSNLCHFSGPSYENFGNQPVPLHLTPIQKENISDCAECTKSEPLLGTKIRIWGIKLKYIEINSSKTKPSTETGHTHTVCMHIFKMLANISKTHKHWCIAKLKHKSISCSFIKHLWAAPLLCLFQTKRTFPWGHRRTRRLSHSRGCWCPDNTSFLRPQPSDNTRWNF